MSLVRMRTAILPFLLLAVHCSSEDSQGHSTGGEAGLAGEGGTASGGGGASLGGSGGIATGGSGIGGCGVGGVDAYCTEDGFVHGYPLCEGVSPPNPIPCTGDTPLCSSQGCAHCPGTGGSPMVSIGAACVDSTEVTRADYEAWLATDPSTFSDVVECQGNTFAPDPSCMSQPDVCSSDCDMHPQTCVDWCDANAFCSAMGKRLCRLIGPTMDEYENKVALNRACHARTSDAYPYGPSLQPGVCNGSDLGIGTTVPVGSLTECVHSFTGPIFDLVGNVWEWDALCDESDGCTAHGGSYLETSEANTCTVESSPHPRDFVATNLGFRCCWP